MMEAVSKSFIRRRIIAIGFKVGMRVMSRTSVSLGRYNAKHEASKLFHLIKHKQIFKISFRTL